ncbi:hypothetical protein BGZ72_000254 [Mortierella alpina]|nr:hypothetical protein BGZ72_000254 [Mortierella alpina]
MALVLAATIMVLALAAIVKAAPVTRSVQSNTIGIAGKACRRDCNVDRLARDSRCEKREGSAKKKCYDDSEIKYDKCLIDCRSECVEECDEDDDDCRKQCKEDSEDDGGADTGDDDDEEEDDN